MAWRHQQQVGAYDASHALHPGRAGRAVPELGKAARTAGIALLLGSSTQAFAQSEAPPTDDGNRLQEIVVTAQRRSENLQDVPISVTALDANALAKTGVTGTYQLNQVAPSVQLTRSGPQTIFFVRGVGNTTSNFGEEGANAFYVDGVYIGDLTSLNMEFNDIERVEVLKGPQGTLFGRNASGGLVQVITREPGESTEVKAQAGYANYDTKQGQLYAATPLNNDISVSIALTGRDQNDGWGKNKFDGSDFYLGWMWGGRAKLVWRGADTKVVLAGDLKRSNDTFSSAFTVFKGTVGTGGFTYEGDYNINQAHPGLARVKADGQSLTIEHDFGGVNLTSISATRYARATSNLDGDYTPVELSFVNVEAATRYYQQEVRLSSDTHSPLTWQLGGFYYNATAKLLGQTVTGLNVGGIGRGLRIVSTGKTDSYAAFGEVSYDITSSTHLTGGLRYTSEERSTNAFEEPVNQVPGSALFNAFTIPVKTQSAKFHKLTYRAAIGQDLTDNVNVYGSYNRGFKSGIFSLHATPGTSPITRPQTIDAIEIGAKSELFDRLLRLNVSAFHYKIKDYQVRTAAPGNIGTAILLNAAAVKVDGLEGELQLAPTRSLRVTGSATLLDSRFSDFPSNPFYVPRTTGNVATPCVLSTAPATGGNQLCFGPATGNRTPLSPRLALSLGATYTIDVGDQGGLTINGLYSHSSNSFFEADNRLKSGKIDVFNASVEYRISPRFGVELFGKNLTDQHYYITGTGSSSADRGELAPPLTYGLNLKFDL